MEQEFWLQRWQQNQIGFHRSEISHYLQEYFSTLALPTGSNIFVPLCGKSLDMLWFYEQGYSVIGVELSALAIEDFFQENNLPFKKSDTDELTLYQSDGIVIYCGDYMKLTSRQLGTVQFVYDRASLIALPPHMRRDYVRHHVTLVDANTPVLLVTLEYPQHQMDGPPFSVDEEEVTNLYRGRYEIEKLMDEDVLAKEGRFAERGISSLHEKIYLLS